MAIQNDTADTAIQDALYFLQEAADPNVTESQKTYYLWQARMTIETAEKLNKAEIQNDNRN